MTLPRKLPPAFYEWVKRHSPLPERCDKCGRPNCPLVRFLAVPNAETAEAMERDCEAARTAKVTP